MSEVCNGSQWAKIKTQEGMMDSFLMALGEDLFLPFQLLAPGHISWLRVPSSIFKISKRQSMTLGLMSSASFFYVEETVWLP